MPLIFDREVFDHARVGLWKIDETKETLEGLAELDPDEETRYASFKSEIRKKQWLSYRILLKKMLAADAVHLEYDRYGKPRLRDSTLFLSISHSGNYSAAITSQTTPAGIDIETLKDRIYRISERFLSSEEIRNVGEDSRLEKLTICWGAKEAVYKIYGRPEVDFQRDIYIGTFPYLCTGKGRCTARMNTPEGNEFFDVFYEKISGYMLVYALKTDGNK
ncbi:MAG: 4'-phosphopantetheinyl transferase superfamily protein [Bacteroidetes bacterium]|nr:4'-phosphopantetheinyl transferase superfamily protein [Bacteroidota bacterium]